VSQVSDYCDRLFLAALASPQVKRIEKVRQEEDATGQIGFMRYRLTLSNDDLLELTERIEVRARAIVVTKYRHHWQDHTGRLIKRWDNAPHYPHVPSFPHHLHDGAEDNVVEHPPVDALQILHLIMESMGPSIT
jgi:Family of unknown function (DUF6516)